jgi:hypothetical protein
MVMSTEKGILLALNGPSQTGKTLTIKNLAQLMGKSGWKSVYRGKKWVECLEVFEHEGFRAGVTSRSDKFPILVKNLEFLRDEWGCRLLIFAANRQTKGLLPYLEAQCREGWTLQWLEKWPDFADRSQKDLHPRQNEAAALALLKQIGEILSKTRQTTGGNQADRN